MIIVWRRPGTGSSHARLVIGGSKRARWGFAPRNAGSTTVSGGYSRGRVVNHMPDLDQSTATSRMVFMTDASDHVSGKPGLTLTITASKAGGAFASISPTVTERGNGWYAVNLTTSHTDTLGDLALHVTGGGADPSDLKYNVMPAPRTANVTQVNGSAATTQTVPSAADNAAAWGASVVGNGRTRDYFLQGGVNKISFDVPSAGQFTVFLSDDTTPLYSGSYTRGANTLGPLVTADPA